MSYFNLTWGMTDGKCTGRNDMEEIDLIIFYYIRVRFLIWNIRIDSYRQHSHNPENYYSCLINKLKLIFDCNLLLRKYRKLPNPQSSANQIHKGFTELIRTLTDSLAHRRCSSMGSFTFAVYFLRLVLFLFHPYTESRLLFTFDI